MVAQHNLARFFEQFTILPLTEAVAYETARLRGELRQHKLPIQHRAFDLVIAATALVHGLTLVTANTRDFSDIPGLVLLNHRTGDARP